ncbi:hypothetical protein IF1G_05709 [Cordyceps javanica]|uniref:Uncharacterized protein n=1 Tax=Cordyceps javanica TaxID=43265 RepID=A0A545V2D4_9HYPO|nr:hypothetical protein IF1G_05709 [Cordyceps javanica]
MFFRHCDRGRLGQRYIWHGKYLRITSMPLVELLFRTVTVSPRWCVICTAAPAAIPRRLSKTSGLRPLVRETRHSEMTRLSALSQLPSSKSSTSYLRERPTRKCKLEDLAQDEIKPPFVWYCY